MTLGLAITTLLLGLRHGVDWDHIAAISDITAASSSRRRGVILSLWYAAAHAVVVVTLCLMVLVAGIAIPSGVDRWMGRVVGMTLILLGSYLVFGLFRKGGEVRLQSRWVLVFGGLFAGLRRVRNLADRREISVSHTHDHDHPDGVDHSELVNDEHREECEISRNIEKISGPNAPSNLGPIVHGTHSHTHRHSANISTLTLPGQRAGAAAGIGVLHGIGFESPTQIAILASSTSLEGAATGIYLTSIWVLGLLVANTVLAFGAGRGLLGKVKSGKTQQFLGAVAAAASMGLGCFYLFGN
jgi:ABC-type nickel/cobalt efflux system permease component RcnA